MAIQIAYIWGKKSLQIHISLTLKPILRLRLTSGKGNPYCPPLLLKHSCPSIDLLTYKAHCQFRGNGTWFKRWLLAVFPFLPKRGKIFQSTMRGILLYILFIPFLTWPWGPEEIKNCVVCSPHDLISDTVNKIKQSIYINPAKAKTRWWFYK